MSTNAISSCSVCGRRLEVKVALLGTEVSCPHCQAVFTVQGDPMGNDQAADPIRPKLEKCLDESSLDLMARVEDVLQRSKSSNNHQGASV